MNDMNDWQPDEEYLKWLKGQQEPLNEEDTFLKTYGFEHDCHCAEDYEAGNVGMVSDCWAQMCNDALAKCAAQKTEIEGLKIAKAELEIQLSARA